MNGQIRIELEQANLVPGGTLNGSTTWTLDDEPRRASIRLFWQTHGKGSKDLELVDTIDIDDPRAEQTRAFSFRLPIEPYSFHGRLVSLEWGIEVIAGKSSSSVNFVMAPEGVARQL